MALSSATSTKQGEAAIRSGLLAGVGAYVLWGFLPLLFKLLDHVPAPTIVAHRTIWSFVFVGAILAVAGRTPEIRAVFADWRTVRVLVVSALLLGGNWLIFIYAVETAQVLEVSFGYFVNPLMNVAIGMVLLSERLNRWQALAVGIAVIAIAIQAAALNGVPWIALSLALTFAAYGYIRKTARAFSATGHFVETLVLLPLVVLYLLFTFWRDGGAGPHGDPGTMALLLLTGPATALPLLLFAFALQRLRLVTMGMLQYIAPSLAFLLALVVFGEHLNSLRLVSFALIWVSLIIFTADSVRRHRAAQRQPEPIKL